MELTFCHRKVVKVHAIISFRKTIVGQVTSKCQPNSIPNPTPTPNTKISVELTKIVACELAFARHFSKVFKKSSLAYVIC